MSTTGSVSQRLEGFRAGLNADGYDLQVTSRARGVEIEVVAGPESCEECLVPKSLMADMIKRLLPSDMAEFTLIYPTDHRAGVDHQLD